MGRDLWWKYWQSGQSSRQYSLSASSVSDPTSGSENCPRLSLSRRQFLSRTTHPKSYELFFYKELFTSLKEHKRVTPSSSYKLTRYGLTTWQNRGNRTRYHCRCWIDHHFATSENLHQFFSAVVQNRHGWHGWHWDSKSKSEEDFYWLLPRGGDQYQR